MTDPVVVLPAAADPNVTVELERVTPPIWFEPTADVMSPFDVIPQFPPPIDTLVTESDPVTFSEPTGVPDVNVNCDSAFAVFELMHVKTRVIDAFEIVVNPGPVHPVHPVGPVVIDGIPVGPVLPVHPVGPV